MKLIRLLLLICIFITSQLDIQAARLVNTVIADGQVIDGSVGPFITGEEVGGLLQVNVRIDEIGDELVRLQNAARNNFPPGIPARIVFRGASRSFVNTNIKVFTIPFDEASGQFEEAEVFVVLKDNRRVNRARNRAARKNREFIPVRFRTVVKKRQRLGLRKADISNSEVNREAGILPTQ